MLIPGFLALYNHHLTEAVVVELPAKKYGEYVIEYYTYDKKKIKTRYIPKKCKHPYLPEKIGERFSIYYKNGAPDSLSSTYKYWYPNGFMLADEMIRFSWFVWGDNPFSLCCLAFTTIQFKN